MNLKEMTIFISKGLKRLRCVTIHGNFFDQVYNQEYLLV